MNFVPGCDLLGGRIVGHPVGLDAHVLINDCGAILTSKNTVGRLDHHLEWPCPIPALDIKLSLLGNSEKR
jgi:hypothetical protein